MADSLEKAKQIQLENILWELEDSVEGYRELIAEAKLSDDPMEKASAELEELYAEILLKWSIKETHLHNAGAVPSMLGGSLLRFWFIVSSAGVPEEDLDGLIEIMRGTFNSMMTYCREIAVEVRAVEPTHDPDNETLH